MTTVTDSDHARCESRALLPGTAFELSYRFAPAAHARRILALEAFFMSVRSIAHEVSEPDVGLVKLAWWQRETHPDAMPRSQHPVVRAMHACNALGGIPAGTLDRYYSGIAAFMTDAACETAEDLLAMAGRAGGQEARLESGGDIAGLPDGVLDALGEACFVAWLIRNISTRTCAESWWVPLDLQARHGATRMACTEAGGQGVPAGLVSGLAKLALERLEAGRAELDRALPPAMHHLVVRVAVERRLLRRAARFRQTRQASRPWSPGPRAAVSAWNTARRLNRRQRETFAGPGGHS
jgi:phytoene synthase